ncbi:hypothetical protein ACFL2O_07810 [Thermodesulfobacteriota bacterium]
MTSDGVPARFFILDVINKNIHVPATNVKVFVVHMTNSPDGAQWNKLPVNGPVQVSWRWPDNMPDEVEVGKEAQCTVFRIYKAGQGIQIPTMGHLPNNFHSVIKPNEHLRITIEARADNARSKSIILQIYWNGNWPENENVGKDLNVRVLKTRNNLWGRF